MWITKAAIMYEGMTTYYIDFGEDANTYGTTMEWEVHYKNTVFYSDSVSSTTPESTGGDLRSSCEPELSKQYSLSLDNQASSWRKRAREDPVQCRRQDGDYNNGHRPRKRAATLRADTGGGQRRGRRAQGRGGRHNKERERSSGREAWGESSHVTSTPQPRSRPLPEEDPHREPRQGQQEEFERPIEGEDPGTPAAAARYPEESAQQGLNLAALPRVRPLDNHADFPIIFLRGGINQLKCLRYRTVRNYSRYFLNISKTWSWVRGEGGHSHGRLTVAFESITQRNQFLECVPLPRGVTVAWGKISGL